MKYTLFLFAIMFMLACSSKDNFVESNTTNNRQIDSIEQSEEYLFVSKPFSLNPTPMKRLEREIENDVEDNFEVNDNSKVVTPPVANNSNETNDDSQTENSLSASLSQNSSTIPNDEPVASSSTRIRDLGRGRIVSSIVDEKNDETSLSNKSNLDCSSPSEIQIIGNKCKEEITFISNLPPNCNPVWDFGDGVKKYGIRITRTFNSFTKCTVKLYVDDMFVGQKSFTISPCPGEAVRVPGATITLGGCTQPPPEKEDEQPTFTAKIVLPNRLICGEALIFSSKSKIPGNRLRWQVNQIEKIGADFKYTFEDEGTYTLKLYIGSNPIPADSRTFDIICTTTASNTCNDGIQNGDETDVDCGGSCVPCIDSMSSVDIGEMTIILNNLGKKGTLELPLNDKNLDDTIIYRVIPQSKRGKVTIGKKGIATYTPDSTSTNKNDSFGYEISNDSGGKIPTGIRFSINNGVELSDKLIELQNLAIPDLENILNNKYGDEYSIVKNEVNQKTKAQVVIFGEIQKKRDRFKISLLLYEIGEMTEDGTPIFYSKAQSSMNNVYLIEKWVTDYQFRYNTIEKLLGKLLRKQ